MTNVDEEVKVLQKGKITIPAGIRQRLGIDEGDCLKLQIVDNKLILFSPNTVQKPTELLSGLAEGVQLKEPLKQELKKAASARITRKLSRARR